MHLKALDICLLKQRLLIFYPAMNEALYLTGIHEHQNFITCIRAKEKSNFHVQNSICSQNSDLTGDTFFSYHSIKSSYLLQKKSI